MKHLQSINEFRTIGFKYSEPKVRINAILMCKGELDEEQFSALMKHINVKYENFDVYDEKNELETEDGTLESDIVVEFDILIYNESELETITIDIQNGLNREFNVQVIQFFYKPAPLLGFKNNED